MSVSLDKNPIQFVITIEKDSGGVFTYDPFNGIYEFQLSRMQFAPRYLNTAGYFELDILDEDGNGIFDELRGGLEVTIWEGKTDGGKQKKFLGVIGGNGYAVITNSQDDAFIRLTGPDWGSQILNNRYMNYYIKQKLLSDGTPDDTDVSTKLKTLYYDSLTNPRWYPAQGLTIEDQGVTVDLANINIDADLRTSEIGTSMEPAEDVLKRLDKAAFGAVHDITPEKVFVVYVPQAMNTGIMLVDDHTDATARAWDQTKVGLISGSTEYWNNYEEYRKALWGIGASRANRDTTLYKTAAGGYEELNGVAWAQKIGTITNIGPQYIGIKLYRSGTLASNVTIELREDKAGEPKGSVIRTIDFDKADINTLSAADFRYMDMSGEELNSQVNYWLIVYQNGSAGNTVRWYRDSSTALGVTRAYSNDNGTTWTIQNDSYQFTMDYWYANELRDTITNDYNPIGADNFYSEELIREPELKDDIALGNLLDATATNMFYVKQVFKAKIYAPDTPLENGQRVRIRVTNNPIKNFDNDDWVVAGLERVVDAESDEPDGMFYYDLTAVRLDK